MSKDPKLFDSRVLTRHLEAGLITEKEVENHFKSLEDQEPNAEYVNIVLDESEIAERVSTREVPLADMTTAPAEGEIQSVSPEPEPSEETEQPFSETPEEEPS